MCVSVRVSVCVWARASGACEREGEGGEREWREGGVDREIEGGEIDFRVDCSCSVMLSCVDLCVFRFIIVYCVFLFLIIYYFCSRFFKPCCGSTAL